MPQYLKGFVFYEKQRFLALSNLFLALLVFIFVKNKTESRLVHANPSAL